MPKYKPLYSLYKGLKESKYDVPDSYVSFQKTLTQPGNAGAKSRRGLYQSLKDSNYDVPDTYEDFYKNLFVPVNSTTSRALKIGENPDTPTVNRYRQKMFDSVDPNKNGLNNLSNRAVGQAVRATNNVRKPVIAKVVNQKGKPTGKEFAITPAKTAEDLDREYAQETTKNWENELHDQMADADKDAAKISDMFKSFIGSTDEVGSVWSNMTRGGGIAGTPHSVTTNNGILENTEARQLLAAGDYNRKRRELLQLEKDSRNGAIFDNHSFFRGMYDAAKDTGFLTGGASDLINAGSLLATKQDLDNGVHTEAGDMLMQQAVKNSDSQSQYGDNQGWMYTGGVITTNMAPFMVQIGSAGFSKGMSNAIGKVVQGAASKVALGTMEKATGMAGAHIANYIGKVTGLTTKAFGKAIQYGIVGAAQANTVGLGNVANDVINRYTGQVYQDEQGNYKFGTFDSDGKLVHEGGEDFLTALVKGDAAQTIEFATELAGGGIDAAGTALKNFVTKGGKKIINKYNMENVSKVIDFLLNNKVSKNARYLKAGADRTLGKVELNSIVGESLEEELGIIANTVFTGDNKISDLWDEKQQSQIWGGMLLSIGLMKGAVAPFHAYNAKQYYSYKHKLDKADVNLSQLLGKEKWEELRNQIDATTNDDMPEMVNKINRDVALGKNRQPVREYIQNLLIMRGYDIGNMLAAKKAVEDKGEGVSVKNMEKNQAYQQGRDAYGYDTHEIQLDQEDKQKSLAQLLGISEQQLASMSDEELETLSGRDDNIDRAIYDYQLSTARYEGVIDNARDQIDLEVQRAAQAVDMYTDKSRNTIRNATIKATGGLEDYGVYIINGNIATHEDGSIDISNSDDMILYYDPTTNTVEHADAMMFAELGSEENADEVRSQAMADAKEKAIKETTGIIDGVVEVGTQFKTVDADGTEHTYEVLADNGDGTAMITIDGNIPTELVKGENVNIPVSFEELQKMKDESDQQRLQAAKAEREQMEKERAEQQNQETEETQPSFDFKKILNDNGNVVLADVLDEDGNTRYPNSKLFLIRDSGAKAKVVELKSDGTLKSHAVDKKDVRTATTMSLDEYKQAMAESSMIEENSGSIEADRGGIEVEDNTQPLSEADADNVIAQMESSAEVAPDLELTPDNWAAEFGEDGIVSTPIGDVKMGENQVAKLFEKGRSKEFGMIKPTLTNPDVIIEVPSHSTDGNEERSSSYLFIKTFLGKNGKKVYYFKSVTIKKDGLEISISSHYDRAKRVKEALMKGKLLYRKNDGAQTEQNQPSTSVTTSQEDAAGSSESKDTNISSNGNENNESLTFEDGTPIPVDMNGEVDLSQADAAHAAEWYDNNLGEDADEWLDGEIKKAKKVLEQAKNKKLAGTKPSELVASKKEKEAAIADAQAHYDSAISIRDSLKERRIAKEEDTAEGRRNLIEKAKRKFARLKSAVKDDAVSQLYRETIGSLLHRLYDSTGIDVTDTTPLTAEEYVASNLGAHSLNYEGTETSKGVKQETGLSREDFAKTQLLAADGKGTTIDALVHSLWENRPSNLESLDTQDIRNALIGVLNSGFKASEARNFVENIRIAQAENILEEQKRAQENAAYAEQHKAELEAELKAKSDEKAELKAKSDEKLDNESSNESNDLSNETDNEKTNDNINDNINTPEVPEDATEENPLGLPLSEDKVPFEIEGGKSGETYDINDNEDRQRLINDNKVDDKDILDIDMPKHVHKAIKELCKKMGLKVQFLYMGARSNGWIENGTMYLALDTEKATQFVFGHEMTHAIKQKNPEAYKELVKVAMAVTTKKKFEEDLAKVYQNYHGISGYNNVDDYVEEVVADNLGKFINNFDLAQKFSLRLNHPVLATILHAIQKIKSLLYGDFYKSVDALERIVEKAYVDTANGQVTNSETGEDVSFSLRQKPEPKKKGIGYKVFVLKDGKLYPPMVANPDGAATPVGVWLDADAAPIAGESKTGRPQVKQGGKGTQGGSGKLACRPGWHLGVVPYAIQFNRKDAEGNKTLFPKNFVFAEVEYAADVDYQEEARQEGINPSGKYQHSLAGLKHLPTDGYYMYRTNPNPETDPWVITGAMKVNRILTRAEQAELVKNAGREPQQIQEGDIVTDDVVNSINQEIADAPKFSLKVYHGSGADFTEFDFDHMGEGAGSQVFGWGGYVTSSKKIGKDYASIKYDPDKDVEYVGKNKKTFTDLIATLFDGGIRDYNYVKNTLLKISDNDKSNISKKEEYDWFVSTKPEDWFNPNPTTNRNLYEVNIPEDNGSNYLEWEEKPSDEVATKIIEGLYGLDAKTLDDMASKDIVFRTLLYDYIKNADKEQMIPILVKTHALTRGTTYDNGNVEDDMRFVYNRLSRWMGSQKAASQFLSSLGFTGIKYPAGTIMGGAEEGDTNYVIFKPEDMQITEHTKFSLKSKPVRFEAGKKLSDEEKKEVLSTLKDAYKVNGVPYHIEETAGGKEKRVYEPTADSYVVSDITNRPLRYYITLPDGRVAHPTEVYPNISDNEVKSSATKQGLLDDEADQIVSAAIGNMKGIADNAKALEVLTEMQNLPHETHDVGYGMNNAQSYNYKTGIFTSDAAQAIDYVVRRMRRKEDVPAEIPAALKKAVADSYGMVDNLIDGMSSTKFSLKDNQGNPLNQDGTLKLDKIKSVDELTDEDFTSAFRNVELPAIPKNMDAAIGANGKPIVIKKNIFEKNWNAHKFTPAESKKVLNDALYNTDLVGHTQPTKKPNHWVAIKLDDKSPITVLEVNDNKDNVEVVGWYTLDERNLGRIKRQAERNGGELIMLTPKDDKVESLSTPSLSSAAKIDNSSETAKKNGEKFSLKDEKTLAGVHNISEEKLLKAIKQGGLANPSVAVIDSSKQDHKAYGDISLILPSDKVAKRTGKNAGTWQGDAYTPTYPQVERHISDKGSEQVNKDVLSVPKEMQHEVRNGIYRWLDGDANSGLKYLFLHEKGNAPKMVELQHKYSDKVYNDLKSITSGNFDISSIGKADAQKVLDMYIDNVFGGDRDAYDEKQKYRIARYKKQVAEGVKNPFLLARAKNALEQYDKYGFYFDKVQEFVRKVESDHRMTGFDTNATLNDVEDYIKTNNLTDEFNTWLEGKEKEYGIKEVIFDGFTPSGNRRYVPNTLENVSKIMKKQGRNGATGAAVSFQNFAARLMPSYGTLKDIRSKKGLLTSDREKFDKFRDKWSNVFFELGMKCQPDATGTFDDYGLARLSEAAMTSDPQAYLKKEYNVDFSDEDTKRLKEMVKAIKEEQPAMYFETKFERPVSFDEFSSAVVPSTASNEVKQALQNAGVQIYEYDKEKEGDRSRAFNEAINSSDNIRFSLAGERGAAAADKAEERTARMDFLSVARKMEEEKKDAKAIKIATGWERGADGKWRYEMPDFNADKTITVDADIDISNVGSYSPYKEPLCTLSDLIDNKNLFAAYPSLKDIDILLVGNTDFEGMYDQLHNNIALRTDAVSIDRKFSKPSNAKEIEAALDKFNNFWKSLTGEDKELADDALDAYGGYTDEELNEDSDFRELEKENPKVAELVRLENSIPSKNNVRLESTQVTLNHEGKFILIHEIQHAIQDIEGFAKGGSPATVKVEIKKRFDEVTKQIKQLRAEGKEDEAKALIEKNRSLYNAYTKNDDFNSYKSLAGEVEARNVSARLNMTPEERRKSLAESTEDVARKDQIFLGVGDVSFSLRDMADGKENGAADMAEDLKSLNTPDEVDDAIKTAIDDMPSGWQMANKKMIHVAQALGENRKAEIAGEEPKFSLKDGSLIKAGTYFSGGGLVEEGLKGIIDPVVAVEYDEKISGVYRNNFGQHIVTADVRDVDPKELVKQIDGEVEYFHASPVCKNYSQAKSNHAEVELDKETAASTAEFINAVKPKVVTIENVKGYKDSDAMKTITDALDANGYTWDADVYNAADYGGYTNRERLIVRAVRDGKLPEKPKKMAHKSGWYEAVADIIPTLTEKKNGVAPWMDIRLKADGIDWRNIDKPLYVMGSAYADGKVPHAFADELLPTLRTKSGDVIVMPDGKVYRAMGRVLARVSGVSDDYKMPFSESLSHTIIGNGIPTQLTEHVIAPLLTGSDPKFSIRTYHGTGASFDKFDFSHMGEGEGSQAFGWGGYVTNSKEIAEDYTRRAKMRKNNGGFEFVTDLSESDKDMVRHYIYKYKDVDKGLDAMRKDLSSALEMFPDDDNLKELSDILAKKNEEIAVPDDIAYLYDVDIPDDNGDYLDWENKLKKSHLNKVNKELVRIGKEPIETIYPSRVDGKVRGQDLYDELSSMLGSKEAASKLLSDAGFVGIKYPAGTIYGGAEEGDYNYVIFDENNANIVGNTRFSLRYDKFEHDLNQWKKDNNLPKDAQRPTIPQRNAGESAVDFLKRVDEYRKQMALWKTAPTYEQHLLSDDTALGEFNRELQKGSVLKRIAFQDSMLAIRKAQEAIMKEVGVDRLNMAEDAYTAENRSHGKGKNEFEEYNNEFLQPLRKAYHQMKKILGDSYDNVRIYMIAKHGLERDAQMAFKKSLDADFDDVAKRSAAYRAYKGDMNRIINDSDLEYGRIDFKTWRNRDNLLRTKYSPSYMAYRYDNNGIVFDYSGLSALFGGPDFEEAGHKLVRDIEDKYVTETHDLWDATNAATKKILRDGYKAGMMSKDTYQYVRDMYGHYIPLRGWDGTTADQVWDYVGGGKGSFNQTLKTAHGRTSIADDPIAYIENMAESGILLNNKNWVKQHLMLLAQNHPTSLLTLSKGWYVKSTDANGNEEWIPATPQITSQMNSNQVKATIDAFEKKMEQMAATGDATQKRDGLNIAYPQTHSEEREHEVRVMKDGEEYVIYVNGDPQLAQAMNNTRAHRVREIQSGKLDRAAAWLGRKMAAAYTSLSPLFIPSNYFRDLTMTLASTAIREDGRYNYLLRKNMATSWNLGFMLRDYQSGKLREKVSNGNATPKEQMFCDFMMNGGETGFVSSLDVEDLKKKFKNDLKDLDRWKANPVKVGHTIMDSIEFLNRMIEDSNRFAVYMTSIQYGRSIDEAVNDAKDVTLNFNRKGTGEYDWQMIRNLYLFINPAVQSLQTLGALAKHHPFKFTAVTASWLASGVLVPIVNAALMSLLGGDDDKDKYWQFSKWDRRNNFIMWVPTTHEFVKIPLAQEFRAFYAIGDMIASKMMGGELAEESWSQHAEDLLGQVVDMLPLDPTGYDGNIAVSLMPNAIRPVFELAFNVDFTGKPLFKETEYNKYDPNFTKVYVGTPDWLVRASRMMNSIGNDYPDVQQNKWDALGDPRYSLNNPAVVDHVLSSYLGGAYTMGSQVLGVLTKSLNDPKEIKVADIPLFSKFVSNPDDRPVTKKQGDEFWNMKENHDRAANTLSKLKKQAKVDGDYSMLERFYDSEEYKQYKQDDVKVKKYEEDKKKERAEESGEEYRPHKLNAEDIYKAHATPKDDFEDLKLKQLYTKLNGFKTSYDLLVDTAPSQSDGYYNTNKVAIDAIDEISLDKQEISELKKGFLDDGKDAYNAEDMKQIRDLRKKILAVLEKANKVVVANQKAKTEK